MVVSFRTRNPIPTSNTVMLIIPKVIIIAPFPTTGVISQLLAAAGHCVIETLLFQLPALADIFFRTTGVVQVVKELKKNRTAPNPEKVLRVKSIN